MIWWLWTAFNPVHVEIINLNEWWADDPEFPDQPPDVYWLGEAAWTARHDNMGIGLQ